MVYPRNPSEGESFTDGDSQTLTVRLSYLPAFHSIVTTKKVKIVSLACFHGLIMKPYKLYGTTWVTASSRVKSFKQIILDQGNEGERAEGYMLHVSILNGNTRIKISMSFQIKLKRMFHMKIKSPFLPFSLSSFPLQFKYE